MANVSKLKKFSRLGIPPTPEEASNNLTAPEVAPAGPERSHLKNSYRRRDGRSMRRTGRTLAFATRVTLEFDERLREIAERDDLMLVEVLERALDAYESQTKL